MTKPIVTIEHDGMIYETKIMHSWLSTSCTLNDGAAAGGWRMPIPAYSDAVALRDLFGNYVKILEIGGMNQAAIPELEKNEKDKTK